MRDKSRNPKPSIRTKPHKPLSQTRRKTTLTINKSVTKQPKTHHLEDCTFARTDFPIEYDIASDETKELTPLQILVKDLMTNDELYKEVQFLDKKLKVKTRYMYDSLIYIEKYKQSINVLKGLLKQNLAIYAETVGIQNSKKQSRKRSLHQRRLSIHTGTSNLNQLNEKSLETATKIQKSFTRMLMLTKNVRLVER